MMIFICKMMIIKMTIQAVLLLKVTSLKVSLSHFLIKNYQITIFNFNQIKKILLTTQNNRINNNNKLIIIQT